jgi:SnoaL-like domain
MSLAAFVTTNEHPVIDADYVQLSRLVTEITWRIDHGEAEMVHELFVDDGVLNLGAVTLSGREEIREWGRKLVDHPTYPGIRHVTTNMRFVADGADQAVGTTIVTAYLDQGNPRRATLPFVVGEDQDRFVRTDQGWRFASRRWDALFERSAR